MHENLSNITQKADNNLCYNSWKTHFSLANKIPNIDNLYLLDLIGMILLIIFFMIFLR